MNNDALKFSEGLTGVVNRRVMYALLMLAGCLTLFSTPSWSAEVATIPPLGDLGELGERLNGGELPLAPDLIPPESNPNLPRFSEPSEPDFKSKATMLQLDGVAAYSNYVKSLHDQLRVNWKPKHLAGKAGGRTVVNFEIGKDGQLVKLEVAETSGNGRADNTALDAVRHSAPFPNFPTALNMESMVIQYTFDFYKPF